MGSTQRAFRDSCISVLADKNMKSQFNETFASLWQSQGVQEGLIGCLVTVTSSQEMGNSFVKLLRNSCGNVEVASGRKKFSQDPKLTTVVEDKPASRASCQSQ